VKTIQDIDVEHAEDVDTGIVVTTIRALATRIITDQPEHLIGSTLPVDLEI
jgi:hypothetical protein